MVRREGRVRQSPGYRPCAETITPFTGEQPLVVVSLIRHRDRRNAPVAGDDDDAAAASDGDGDDDGDREDGGRRR